MGRHQRLWPDEGHRDRRWTAVREVAGMNFPRPTFARPTITALACLVTALAGVTARGADADLSALQPRVDRLAALTERVEAISAIKRLQHAYGHYAELGLWHDFAELFADSGVGYYTQGALDREGIR